MKTLVKVAIRLVAAIMIYEATVYLIAVSSTFLLTLGKEYSEPWYYYPVILMVYLVILIVLALFWIKADRIVRFIAGPIRGNEVTINTSNTDLLAVALSVFGIFMIVNSLVDLGALYAYQWQLKESTPQGVSPGQEAIEASRLVRDVLSIVIGAGLVLGNKGIKRLGKWLNEIGKNPEEPEGDIKAG